MKQVEVVVGLRAPVDRVVEVLTKDPGSVFRPDAPPGARSAGRYRHGLTIDVADGATLHHEVWLQVDRAIRSSRGVALALHVEPVGHRHLLPVFDGELEARAAGAATQLVLKGGYTVPFGVIGRFGDALAGHHSAQQSLERLVTELAQRLEVEVDRRMDAGPPFEAPTQTGQQSDYYLG